MPHSPQVASGLCVTIDKDFNGAEPLSNFDRAISFRLHGGRLKNPVHGELSESG